MTRTLPQTSALRRRTLVLLGVALLAIMAGITLEVRLAAEYRRRLETQSLSIARWEQVARARAESEATSSTAALRQDGGRTTETMSPATASDPASAQQSRAWAERTKRLRAWMAKHPREWIPELELLGDQNWLSITREATLDEENDFALAAAELRGVAKGYFVELMRSALRAYLRTHEGILPVDTLELLRHFPLTSHDHVAMLERYRMVRSGKLAAAPEGPLIEEKKLIRSYEARHAITTDGAGGLSIETRKPSSKSVEEERIKASAERAVAAFVKINQGQKPTTPAQLIPYFDPPLRPEHVKRFTRPLTRQQLEEFQAEISRVAAERAP